MSTDQLRKKAAKEQGGNAAEGRRKRNQVDGEGGDGGKRCEEKGYNTELGGGGGGNWVKV